MNQIFGNINKVFCKLYIEILTTEIIDCDLIVCWRGDFSLQKGLDSRFGLVPLHFVVKYADRK